MTIDQLKHKRRQLLREMKQINDSAGDRNLTAEQSRLFNQLKEQVDRIDADIEDRWAHQSAGVPPFSDPAGGPVRQDEIADYSLIRAIHSAASGQNSPERELRHDLARRNGLEPGGLLVPVNAILNAITTAPAEGGALVPTEHRTFIDALRPRLSVARLGATVLSNLRGNVSMPRQVAASTVGWKPETGDLDQESPDFGALELSPKRVGAYAVFSKQLLAQSDPSVQRVLANDLLSALAVAVDKAAIQGSGSNNEPTGILNTSGVVVVPIGENGGAPEYAHLVDLVRQIANSNADENALAFLTNPSVRAKLQGTTFDAGSGLTHWDKAQGLGPFAISTNVPSNLTKGSGENLSALIHGDFSSVVLGQWGDFVDIVVDPFTEAVGGKTRIILNAFADVGIRRAEQFAVVKDASTN